MPINQITPAQAVTEEIQRRIKAIEKATINALTYVGEACVRHARELDTYKDQTNNLRSSIGYAVLKDGRPVKRGSMENVGKGAGTGQEGVRQGESFRQSLFDEFPTGIALIVTAGMNYAAHVERNGYDVTESAELLAKRMVPQILSQIGLTAAA